MAFGDIVLIKNHTKGALEFGAVGPAIFMEYVDPTKRSVVVY